MSKRCDACMYIYPQSQTTCPHCGGLLYSDSLSNQTWIDSGYVDATNNEPISIQPQQTQTQGYFQQLQQTQPAQPIQPPRHTPVVQEDEAYNRRLQRIEKEQRSLERRAAVNNFFYRFQAIPWGGMMRFAMMVFIILLLITIWISRKAILSFFVNLLLQLIPILLILYAILSLIRMPFH